LITGNSRFAVSVHILAYLAFRRGAAVPSAEIAGSFATNPVVIRRLLSALVKARLVSAQKGANGGFALASTPPNISLLDVYRAVEPTPNHGLRTFTPNHKCPVGAKIEFILHGVFFKAQAGMETALARFTLAAIDQELRPIGPGKK